MSTSGLAQSIRSSSPRDLQRQIPAYNTVTEDLFKPYLWTTNGPLTEAHSPISEGNELSVSFRVVTTDAFIGLIWESEDNFSHEALKYHTYSDYTGVVWVFDVVQSASMPLIDDATKTLTLDITTSGVDGTVYVPIPQYCDTSESRSGRVTIDFDNLVGNRLSDAQQVTIDPAEITRITIGLIADTYINGDSSLLATPQDCTFTLTTVSVTGGATFTRNDYQAEPHDIGMSTSFDDMHNISPERVIKTLKALGFNGKINHYCGMSKYPNNAPVNGSLKFIETLGTTINNATKDWHLKFAELLSIEEWDCIWSVSFEMFSPFANQDYAQRDWSDNFGVTGYTPPSYLADPSNANAMSYLGNVFEDFAGIMSLGGISVIMQIGEPWWWWNTATRKPCIYGANAKNKFRQYTLNENLNSGSGYFAPEIETVNDLVNIDINDNTPITGSETVEQLYIKWCRDELGAACYGLRDRVKSAHPSAKVTLLFFMPSILDDRVGIMQLINYPKDTYKYPGYDFIMTEGYDWLIEGDMPKVETCMTVPINDLNYPPQLVEYLAGFVPAEELAAAINFTVLDVKYKGELWSRIDGSIKTNQSYNISRQYIWAYPQVVSDNYIVLPGSFNAVLDRQLIRPIESKYPPKYIEPAS